MKILWWIPFIPFFFNKSRSLLFQPSTIRNWMGTESYLRMDENELSTNISPSYRWCPRNYRPTGRIKVKVTLKLNVISFQIFACRWHLIVDEICFEPIYVETLFYKSPIFDQTIKVVNTDHNEFQTIRHGFLRWLLQANALHRMFDYSTFHLMIEQKWHPVFGCMSTWIWLTVIKIQSKINRVSSVDFI